MHWLADLVQHALLQWGYVALIAGLLGEDAGLPLPGETVLMFASFLAHKTGQLSLAWIIAIGIVAAVMGDNLGFFAGRWLGRRLLRWLKAKFGLDDEIAVASDQIHRHGPATIFWARYVFGLRTIAGPVAGALEMEWKTFLLYNALGAATWVTTIALSGYLFANEFDSLLGYFEKGSWAISLCILGAGYVLWRRKKKEFRERVEAGNSRGRATS
jgi:membrane-associated protein